MNVESGVDFENLVIQAKNQTGADIKSICTEAGMFAIRDNRTCVTQDDFRRAIDKVQSRGRSDTVPSSIYC